MLKKMKSLFVEEQGQGMTEYGLILGLIALAAVGVLVLMGPKIAGIFTKANTKLDTVTGN